MIRTSGLKYTYLQGAEMAFPDLGIGQGEHTLILGNSGCGKTTLLHILSGLRRPTEGEVMIMDKSLTAMTVSDQDRLRGKLMGMIFQIPHFVKSLTVRENILLAQSLAQKPVDSDACLQLLDQLKIRDKAEKKTNELSVGEQQRVAIARALINDPKIVFADEPTSALDDSNTEIVIELLKSQAELHNATLVVVTHDQRLKDNFQNQVLL